MNFLEVTTYNNEGTVATHDKIPVIDDGISEADFADVISMIEGGTLAMP